MCVCVKVFEDGGGSDDGYPIYGSSSDLQIRFLGAESGQLPGDTIHAVVCYKAIHNNLAGSTTLKGHLILSPIFFF